MSVATEVWLGRLTGTQLRQPRAQLIDLFVAAQTGHGGGQLVAGALQFAAALVGRSRGREVNHISGLQRRSQFFLCRGVFRLDIECRSRRE